MNGATGASALAKSKPAGAVGVGGKPAGEKVAKVPGAPKSPTKEKRKHDQVDAGVVGVGVAGKKDKSKGKGKDSDSSEEGDDTTEEEQQGAAHHVLLAQDHGRKLKDPNTIVWTQDDGIILERLRYITRFTEHEPSLKWEGFVWNNEWTAEKIKERWNKIARTVRTQRGQFSFGEAVARVWQHYQEAMGQGRVLMGEEYEEFKANGGRRLKKKKKKDPEAPKRPDTAYMIFTRQKREELKDSMKGAPMTEVMKKLAELWRSLPPTNKSKYEKKAEKLKAAYMQHKQEYLLTHPKPKKGDGFDGSGRKRKRDDGKRRARTGNQIWKDEYTPVLRQTRPELTFGDLQIELGKIWKELPEERKKPYMDRAAVERDQIRREEEAAAAAVAFDPAGMDIFGPGFPPGTANPQYIFHPSSVLVTQYAHPQAYATAGGSEKPAKKRAKKDPNAPKPPLKTAYLLWASQFRPTLTEQQPLLSFEDISRQLGVAWKSLSEHERNSWEERLKQEREKYIRDFSEYVRTLPEGDRARALREAQEGEKEAKKKAKKAAAAAAVYAQPSPNAGGLGSLPMQVQVQQMPMAMGVPPAVQASKKKTVLPATQNQILPQMPVPIDMQSLGNPAVAAMQKTKQKNKGQAQQMGVDF